MASKSITLSKMSDGRLIQGEPVIPRVEATFSGERNESGGYTIYSPHDFIVLPPEVARRIAAHILETDDHVE